MNDLSPKHTRSGITYQSKMGLENDKKEETTAVQQPTVEELSKTVSDLGKKFDLIMETLKSFLSGQPPGNLVNNDPTSV